MGTYKAVKRKMTFKYNRLAWNGAEFSYLLG